MAWGAGAQSPGVCEAAVAPGGGAAGAGGWGGFLVAADVVSPVSPGRASRGVSSRKRLSQYSPKRLRACSDPLHSTTLLWELAELIRTRQLSGVNGAERSDLQMKIAELGMSCSVDPGNEGVRQIYSTLPPISGIPLRSRYVSRAFCVLPHPLRMDPRPDWAFGPTHKLERSEKAKQFPRSHDRWRSWSSLGRAGA